MPCKKRKVDFEKNLVLQLNEFYPGLEFEFTREGPVHQPNFMTRATAEGQEFTGFGNSKAKAKRDLAAKVLSLVAIKDITKGFDAYSITKDLFNTDPSSEQQRNSKQSEQMPSQLTANLPPINREKAQASPAMVLTELFPEMTTEWAEGAARHFRVDADIRGWRFFGEGRSKKIAKTNLAKSALGCMYNVQQFAADAANAAEKTGRVVPLQKKFPLTQLREMFGELQYCTRQVKGNENSPPEERAYQCSVVVQGREYRGEAAKNIRLAKLACAKQALDVLRPRKEASA